MSDRDVLVAALRKAFESGDELDLVGGSRNARPLDIDHPGPSFRNRWFAASYRWMVDSNAARAALAAEPAEGLDAASEIDEELAWSPVRTSRRHADALLNWYYTTHGNEFGHDHHCPVRLLDDADVRCTCGWSQVLREAP